MLELIKVKLLSMYLKSPCQTLPNAMWKTIDFLNEFNHDYKLTDEFIPYEITIWNDHLMPIYWHEDEEKIELSDNVLKSQRILIHEKRYNNHLNQHYQIEQAYFRLMYNSISHRNKDLDNELYRISNVDFNTELEKVSTFLCACYNDIKPSIHEVTSWLGRKVFHNDLWFWIIDRNANIPVGLGIAEYDPIVSEGSLEWIQVLPEYQNRGIGKYIVNELTNRLMTLTNLVTVSGLRENDRRIENMYRTCGYEGNDVWYMLAKLDQE